MMICVTLTCVAIFEVITLGLKDYIPMIYTSDPTILSAINVHLYVVAVSLFTDSMHHCLVGTIIGCGWQHIAAVLSVLWYWIVGVPLGSSLTLAVHLGALGYWIGMATGAVPQLCTDVLVILAVNWKKRSEVAQKLAVHVLQSKEGKNEENESSTSKQANAIEEKSSSSNAAVSEASNNASPEQTSKMEPAVAKENYPQCSARESNCECPHMNGKLTDKSGKRSMARWKIVLLRMLTAAPFIILCAGAVVISQILVYHPTPCNVTTTSNYSECLPVDSPQSELYQTMSASVPLCTSPTGTVTAFSQLPEPTPTFI